MYPLTVHFLVVTVVDSVCPKPCHKYSHIWVSPVTASKRKKNKSGFLQTSAVKGKKKKNHRHLLIPTIFPALTNGKMYDAPRFV